MVHLTLLLAVVLLNCSLIREVCRAIGEARGPVLALDTGLVQGLRNTTLLGRPFLSFRGIPYAAPPVGPLRFKAPQPPKKWSGILQAFTEAPACLQPKREEIYPISFSEDCLFLNVFTPYLKHPSDKLMPVIVWIHGGKYYQGSGNTYKYGPDFLLKKDVVMVSINYRLGVFGYLNMGVGEAQGNAAMKDKVAALQWVRKEISKFGGDPNRVTIWGGSSGASDVNALYISPMAKGLFHRAISHSGVIECSLYSHPSSKALGLTLAHTLGCPSLSPLAAVDCLRVVDGNQLAEAQMMFKTKASDNPFGPSVEEDLGEEQFLPDTPRQLLERTSGAVPYLIGINNAEGLMYVKDPTEQPDQFTNLDKEFITYLPPRWLDEETTEMLTKVTSQLKDFYIGHNSSLEHKINGFVDFTSDRQFGYCSLKMAQFLSTRAPVYFYYFGFEGAFQRKDHAYFRLNVTIKGVCHGEELGYFFQRKVAIKTQNNYTEYPRDMDLLEKTITLWTNFAAYGDPTPTENPWGVIWHPVRDGITNHLVIGDTLIMTDHSLNGARVALWDSLNDLLEAAHTLLLAHATRDDTYRPLAVACFLLPVVMVVLVFHCKRDKKGYQTL